MKLGIIGGGQLARMLALAACPLGIQCICLDPDPNCSASWVSRILVADYDDHEALRELLRQTDCMTYEFENVSVDALRTLGSTGLSPPLSVLSVAQDRLNEKACFSKLEIPTARYRPVSSWEVLHVAASEIGFPCVLKTCRLGYDGKGQFVIKSASDLASAWHALGGQPLLLEELIDFDREVSCIAVRSCSGVTFYPLVVNQHRDGILRNSRVLPFALNSDSDQALFALAERYVTALLLHFDYIGVLTVEFFQKGNELIANEMAPRVHNSGHWTIEGALTSQFENHVRAVFDLPLGSLWVDRPVQMFNIIGSVPDLSDLLKIPGTHLHLYGKQERPMRKLGHITLVEHDDLPLEPRASQIAQLL